MDLKNPSKELQTAIAAAKTGAKVALKYFQTELQITTKTDNSYVTKADTETEEAIKKYILDRYPEAKFVAEESGGNTKETNVWIIDPIDGTRVFTRGITEWSILIAHYKNGEILSGVCYLPGHNLLMFAEKGKGTFSNTKRISVSKTGLVNGSFGNLGSIRHYLSFEPILRLKEKGAILRGYEHSYAACLVAEGKMDFFIDAYGKPWDYAPFICLIQEAGGKVTDFDGNPWDLHSKTLLATNGILHREILKILNT